MNTQGYGARTLIGVLVVLGTVGLAACTADAPRNTAGQVTASAAADVASLKVGDCTGKLDEGEIDGADLVPCKDAHHYEAFAAKTMTGDTYPGQDAAGKQAEEFCSAEFAAFVGVSYDESTYELFNLAPTKESWYLSGDREIMCLVGDDSGAVTGTLKGVKK